MCASHDLCVRAHAHSLEGTLSVSMLRNLYQRNNIKELLLKNYSWPNCLQAAHGQTAYMQLTVKLPNDDRQILFVQKHKDKQRAAFVQKPKQVKRLVFKSLK